MGGDSCRVIIDGKETPLRLEGIDAPELGQAFGTNSKQALSSLIFGKTVEVQPTGKDRYQRILATVVADGKNVNLQMVQQGLAWHFVTYNRDPDLAEAARAAKSSKRGLWVEPNPIAPWDWRRTKKKGG